MTSMDLTTCTIAAPPEKVWAVLADGWLYPLWVVGATRMREVDDHWPAQGARLHHSAGVWPLVLDDETEVLESVPEQRLRLRARGWPAGEAEVLLELREQDGQTLVELHEDAVSGPGRLIPAPVRHPMIHVRNVEALRRLAALAEGR
ncbi:SRPBCC family protein [Alteromonas gracilis]